VGAEEGQGALTGLVSGFGIVIRPLIAVEAVAGAFVEEDGDFRVRLLDFLDFGGGDVFFIGTEMQHDGAGRFFVDESGDLPAVIGDCGGRIKARGGEPCERSTVTESNDTPSCGRIAFRGMIDGRGNVEECFFQADLRGDLHATGGVGGIVVELKTGLDTIEEAGSHGGETLAGVVVNDGTNVTIHTEDFLDDNDGGSCGFGRLSEISAELMAVGGSKWQVGAHRVQTKVYLKRGKERNGMEWDPLRGGVKLRNRREIPRCLGMRGS